jgi:hypothetical protein
LTCYHPTYEHEDLNMRNIYTALHHDKNYNESTVKNLFSDLLKILKKYLICEVSLKNDQQSSINLLEGLSKRNISPLYDMTLKQMEFDINNGKIDTWYYYYCYRLQAIKYNYLATYGSISNINKQDEELKTLKQVAVNLVNYFTMDLTSIYLNSLFYENTSQHLNTTEMISDLTKHMRIHSLHDILSKYKVESDILKLYSSLYDAYQHLGDEQKYYDYKGIVEKHINQLSRDEKTFHYSKMIGYCIINLHDDKLRDTFTDELFNLYENILEKEYYKDRNTDYLPTDLYREIIINGISLKKLGWVKEFISSHTLRLHPKVRENMYFLAQAHYYFAINDSSMTLDYINRIDHTHFIYKYDVYNMKLKVFFDNNEFEGSLDLIETYRKCLLDDKILSEDRKSRYKKFLYYLQKIINYKSSNKKIDISYTNCKLLKETEMYSKEWLIDKYAIFTTKEKQVGKVYPY